MNYFQLSGQRIYVDDESSCAEHHDKKDPPLFHIVGSSKHTPILVRCPKSLTAEEKKRLKEEDK